jgi:hypothetical protein
MEALGGERWYSSCSFSTSALDGGEWSASRPGRAFTPRERTHGTHWKGGWVGPRAGLDTETRGKILCPRRKSNPDRPVVQPVVRHYTAWANPAPLHRLENFKCHNGILIYPTTWCHLHQYLEFKYFVVCSRMHRPIYFICLFLKH